MQFDIARQPLVPAFLTLFALAVTAVCVTAPAAAPQTPEAARCGAELLLPMPGELLSRFEAAHPFWAKTAAALLLTLAGMTVGRFTTRYNLYSVGTCAAIPLVAIVACGAGVGGAEIGAAGIGGTGAGAMGAGGVPLHGFAATALLALSAKNFCRAYRSGYSFDALFRATLYLGMLALVSPAALPLSLLLPAAVALFDRTLREVLVAAAGLLFVPLLFCYVNWGAGGSFRAPLAELVGHYAGTPCAMLRALPLHRLILSGGALLCSILSLCAFFTDIYATGTKQRAMLLFATGLLLLVALLLCTPAATPGDMALLAVPAAVLIPFFLVRTRRFLSSAIYLLLLAGAFASLLLQ